LSLEIAGGAYDRLSCISILTVDRHGAWRLSCISILTRPLSPRGGEIDEQGAGWCVGYGILWRGGYDM